MLLDVPSFASRVRELTVELEAKNHEQADEALRDCLAFLGNLVTPGVDRSKTSSQPMTPAQELGLDRGVDTLDELDRARTYLAESDFQSALVAARLALEKWEKKPTLEAQGKPNPDAPNAEDFDLGDQGQSGG